MLMRKDFIDQNRDAAIGWLKAEIEAEMWYTDPKNHMEAIEIAMKYISGFDKENSLVFIGRGNPRHGED